MTKPLATKSSPLPKAMEECDASGIHLEESRTTGMNDLKDELASLRIDREQPRRASGACGLCCCCWSWRCSAAGLYVVRTKPEL